MELSRASTVVMCAATMAILSSWGCSESPKAREARYLEKGKHEFQHKNYVNAILHFKTAAQSPTGNAEPYYQLGLTYLALNDLNSASSSLRRAIELDPSHTGAQLKLAQLMSMGRRREMVEEAQKLSESVLTLFPDDVEALDTLAVTELRLGKPESAEAHLEQALQTAPSHLKSSVALARARLALKDVAGAEQALKQAAAQAPKSPEPSAYLGEFYMVLGRAAQAEEQFGHALGIDSQYAPALLALAGIQTRAGRTEQADQTYRRVAALPNTRYRPIHGLFLFQAGKRDQAIAEFEMLYRGNPADRNLRTQLVRAYFAVNRPGDAEKVLTAALRKNSLDTDALLQRARIYLAWDKAAEAERDLNQVLHFSNGSAEAHYLLSEVKRTEAGPALQQQELREALRLDSRFLAARISLAQTLIAVHDAQSALDLLDQTPEDLKGTSTIVTQRNWALIALGRRAEAQKAIAQVLTGARVSEALLQDAVLKLDQEDYDGARSSAESVLGENPDDMRALNLIVQSYTAQRQLPTGLRKAQEYAARRPTSAAVQQFLGAILLKAGDSVGARQAFEAARTANPNLVAAELSLAALDASEAKGAEARRRLQALVSSHPRNIAGHMLWARVEFADGKTAAALEQYRKIVDLDKSNAEALNNLAYLLTATSHPDEALKYAQDAKRLAPNSAAVDDTLGWTYYKKGLYSLAVTHLASAAGKEGTARRNYHLAMAYLKAGDLKRGRQVLEVALKTDPNLEEAGEARRLFGEGAK